MNADPAVLLDPQTVSCENNEIGTASVVETKTGVTTATVVASQKPGKENWQFLNKGISRNLSCSRDVAVNSEGKRFLEINEWTWLGLSAQ